MATEFLPHCGGQMATVCRAKGPFSRSVSPQGVYNSCRSEEEVSLAADLRSYLCFGGSIEYMALSYQNGGHAWVLDKC